MEKGARLIRRDTGFRGRGARRVLEDDADTAAREALLLTLWGPEARITTNGPVTLRAARADSPDVALLDLARPGLNAWQVAKKLREQLTGTRPLIVVISGYGTDIHQVRSWKAGADLHLVKPVDLDDLRTLLEELSVGWSRLRDPGGYSLPEIGF